MNWSVSSLKQASVTLLTLVSVAAVSELPAQGQQRLTPPPPVKLVQSSENANEEALKTKASQLIDLLSQEKYEEARRSVNRTLAVELTTDQIGNIWEGLIEMTGPVKQQVSSHVISTVNADLVVIETEFENKTDNFIVTFNKDGEIIGVDFPNVESIEEIAQNVLNAVAINDFARARGYLHPFLKTELFPTQIQTAWQNIQQRDGLFERIIDTQVRSGSSVDNVDVVVVEAQFQKANRKFFFIFDENARITGIDLNR